MKRISLLFLTMMVGVLIFAGITGKVSEVDKYGNAYTDILTDVAAAAGFEVGDIVELQVGSKTVIAPFVRNYGEVDRGNPLIRISSGKVLVAINLGNFSKTYEVVVGTEVILSMLKKGAYKDELEIRNLVRTNERKDYSSDAVFANFREVTLGSIGAGKLYRSSHPSINDPRAPYANELMKQAGIKTIINLSDSDQELKDSYPFSDYYRMVSESGNLINLDMGVDLLSPEFAAKVKVGLVFLSKKSPPYLIHCVEGKDRAGIVTAVLGAMMGASAEDIYNDFVLSFENYFRVKPATPAYNAIRKIVTDIFISIHNGDPVDDTNIRFVALTYLRVNADMSLQEIEELKAKLQ